MKVANSRQRATRYLSGPLRLQASDQNYSRDRILLTSYDTNARILVDFFSIINGTYQVVCVRFQVSDVDKRLLFTVLSF